MKRHLNTLFVTTQDTYLARQREAVVVRGEGEDLLRVPIHLLGGIVCFGKVGASPALLGLCGERGVAVSFLSRSGRFLARVEGPTSGNVLLRREQYRKADDLAESAKIAAACVAGKIANSRAVLKRAARDRPDRAAAEALSKTSERLAGLGARLADLEDLDKIRGVEGEAARAYFAVFDQLVLAQKRSFRFEKRSRRPPLDRINAMLSFAYTLLTHDVAAALQAAGVDPAVGYLHRDRPGRYGLALDLVEELRPVLADRLVLTLINTRQIQAGGFQTEESGRVLMSDDARKLFLEAYQGRKQAEITHPFLGEKTTLGLVPHLQGRLLARYLRGDLDAYPPYLWK